MNQNDIQAAADRAAKNIADGKPIEITNQQKFFALCNMGANMLVNEVCRMMALGNDMHVGAIPLDHLQWSADYLAVSAALRTEQKEMGDTSQDDHIKRCTEQSERINAVIEQRLNPNKIIRPIKPRLALINGSKRGKRK